MSIISPRTFRGTRDFLPPELLARRRILEVIEGAYRRYGFQPLETPAIEYLEILTGKSEENDKLIYEIKRARGEEEESAESAIALRYDLTVPLARVVAQYADLPRPFKRYQIQPVWRADRPQPRQGRFREFVQCDADIVGTDSLLADAEIIALTYEVLRDLGFEKFRIRLSSRKFLFELVQAITGGTEKFSSFCRAIDKYDKIGWEGVGKELTAAGISPGAATGMLETLTENFKAANFAPAREKLQSAGATGKGIDEIEQVYHHALNLSVPKDNLLCDPLLARGLDYYTGPIFESVSTELPHLGSLSGGGRYDGLVGTFSKEQVSATGTTLGLDRIQTALEQLGKFTTVPSLTQVLVTRFDPAGIDANLQIASTLRRAGINVEVWYDDDRMKKQFAYADKQQIPIVVICGPDERARGTVAVKNMKRAEQKEILREQLVDAVKSWLPYSPPLTLP